MKKARLNLNQRPPSNAGSQKITKKKEHKRNKSADPSSKISKDGEKISRINGPSLTTGKH
jgi:hypothetical protein